MHRWSSNLFVASLVVWSLVTPVPAYSTGLICRGECVGAGNVRDGRECFNAADAANLQTLVPFLERNLTRCNESEEIIGVSLTRQGQCRRADRFYCETTIVGRYTGTAINREARECFNAKQASNLHYVSKIVQTNGTRCTASQPNIVGVKLKKIGICYRADRVYCRAEPA